VAAEPTQSAEAGMVTVSIDHDLCRGHQMCVMGLPEVFVVGDNDEGQSDVRDKLQPRSRLEQLRLAARSCPESAIRVESNP
jgi:ferredoxin